MCAPVGAITIVDTFKHLRVNLDYFLLDAVFGSGKFFTVFHLPILVFYYFGRKCDLLPVLKSKKRNLPRRSVIHWLWNKPNIISVDVLSGLCIAYEIVF